jgi:hypothetical protein
VENAKPIQRDTLPSKLQSFLALGEGNNQLGKEPKTGEGKVLEPFRKCRFLSVSQVPSLPNIM